MTTYDIAHSNQRKQASIPKDSSKHRVVSPNSEIIGEGAPIFTDMTETILNTLDQQIAMTPDNQQLKGLSPIDNQMKGIQGGNTMASDQKESYLDLFLPVVENYRISDCFCGYSDSLSADNKSHGSSGIEKSILSIWDILCMQWIELTVLCMVSSVLDIKSYLRRPL